MEIKKLQEITKRIRSDILTITTTAGSGHPSSSLSAVEMMTVLFFKYLRYDLSDPKNPANDRVIFSKGHASPLYYSLYAAAGAISHEDLLKYRTFDSVLEGHPTERFKYTEAATGSLGQGLSIGLGEALALKLLKSKGRVFVLCGDGEIAEGSVWEAAAAASYKKMDNLYLFVDVNRLGQSDPTMYGHDMSVFQKRFEAFGWNVVVIEKGNDLDSVDKALGKIDVGGPTVFLAKTKKGAGISFIEDKDGWHGKPLSKEELPKALAELGEVDFTTYDIPKR
jgi:transketolase